MIASRTNRVLPPACLAASGVAPSLEEATATLAAAPFDTLVYTRSSSAVHRQHLAAPQTARERGAPPPPSPPTLKLHAPARPPQLCPSHTPTPSRTQPTTSTTNCAVLSALDCRGAQACVGAGDLVLLARGSKGRPAHAACGAARLPPARVAAGHDAPRCRGGGCGKSGGRPARAAGRRRAAGLRPVAA